ncbi:Hypothetical predicted protein [Cloeon dipterum]|uniref:C-type lectin domain-containing protein n=1 Tax=Cloeon dipterum TaxID=197152 RepID=A0A8S1DIA9_9INSE|nr:Hypothetical predicted protein [Cloeon dipterum]
MNATFFIPCLVTCLILHLGFSKRPSNNLEMQRKQLQSKSSRQIIIKCCGKNSCLNQLSKKRSRQNSTISSIRETEISSTRKKPSSLKKSSQHESTEVLSETDAVTLVPLPENEPTSNLIEINSLEIVSIAPTASSTDSFLPLNQTFSSPNPVTMTVPLSTTTSVASSVMEQSKTQISDSTSASTQKQNITSTSTPILTDNEQGSSTTSSMSTPQTEVSDKMENSTTVESVEAVVQTDPPDVAVIENASPVPLIGPFAPAYEHECLKNLSLFDPDGHLIEAEDYGAWETTCGSLYLFGSQILSWEENFNFCCSLGMLPLTVEDDWKRSCLQDFIGGVKWPHSSMYWSTGKRLSGNTFTWYDKRVAFSPTLWKAKQPNNVNGTENCVMLRIFKFDLNSVKLEDKHCDKLAVSACVGPTTPAPKCSFPLCTNKDCKKNDPFFTNLVENPAHYLTEPKNHGIWIEVNHRTFMFSFESDVRTFEEANQACCALDFKLLSLHQGYKFRFLSAAFKNLTLKSGKFWTSGSDFGCEGVFGFCSTNRTLMKNETIWLPNQPDNLKGNEHCLAINALSNYAAALSNDNCDLKLRYICEGRASTRVKALELECAAASNLTDAEIPMAFASPNGSEKFKCFMTCYGENANLYGNGKMVDSRILPFVPYISAGSDSSMKEYYGTMGQCKQDSRKLYGCSRVSDFVSCSQTKSPTLTVKMINVVETTISEKKSWLPPVSESLCPNAHDKIMNEDYRAFFDSISAGRATLVPYRFVISTSCGKKFLLLSIEKAPPLTTLGQAMTECAKWGLRLATIDTKTKLNCMINAKIRIV